MTKTKISTSQLAVLLAASRLFTEATEFTGRSYSMQHFTVILVSCLILTALYIPLIAASRKYGDSAFGVIASKSRTAGFLCGAVITVILLSAAVSSVCRMTFYTSATVFSEAPTILLAALPLAVCGYAAAKGIQGLARGSVIIAGLFIAFLVFIGISLSGRYDTGWLYPAVIEQPDLFWEQVIRHVGRNSELLVFGVLSGFAGEKADRAAYFYIPAVFLLSELMLLAETLSLGPFLGTAAFPFFTISAMSDIVLFQRLDGIDAVMWTLMLIVRVSVIFVCVKTVFGRIFGEKTADPAAWLSALAAAAVALTVDGNIGLSVIIDRALVLILPAAGLLLPITALIVGRKGKREVKSSEKA